MVTKNLLIRGGADFTNVTKSLKKVNRDLEEFSGTTRRSITRVNKNIRTTQKEFQTFGTDSRSVFKDMLSQKGLPAISQAFQNLTRSVPVVGGLTASLAGMGSAVAGVTASLGPAGVAIAAVFATIGVGTAIVGAASQQAVRYEASINRLSLALGAGTQAYLDWGKAQGQALGLSEQAVAEIGATQGMLLSSFIPNKRELSQATQEMVRAITVIASNSGRSVQDVSERIRSGMLGSTEAIEDLGIYVNISMIESTNAFRKFAGDKSWAQLDFKTQQLIRQQAIIEQASARYGKELAGNTSSAQARLVAGLQDIQLNLSRAFKPIWDDILPALESLVNGLVTVTENIARFVHWIRGIPYDPTIRHTEETSQAVGDLAEGYDDVASAVKKATLGVAGFDEVNQLNWDSGSQSTATSGTSGTGSTSTNPFPSLDPSSREPIQFPGIVFEPPQPPDMGMGAAKGLAMQIINSLPVGIAVPLGLVTGQWSTMLNSIVTMLTTAKTSIDEKWEQIKSKVSSLNPVTVTVSTAWATMLTSMQTALTTAKTTLDEKWDSLKSKINSLSPVTTGVSTVWATMLSSIKTTLETAKPTIETLWDGLKSKVSSLNPVLTTVSTAWSTMLSGFQVTLSTAKTSITTTWDSLKTSLSTIKSTFDSVKTSWSQTLSSMLSAIQSKATSIISEIGKIATSFANLVKDLAKPLPTPKSTTAPTSAPAPKPSGASSGASPSYGQFMADSVKSFVDPKTLSQGFAQTFSASNLQAMGQGVKDWAEENKVPLAVMSTLVPIGRAAGAVSKAAGPVIDAVKNVFGGMGRLVPGFANGAIVPANSPMLAMVGDNKTQREAIAPVDDLMSMISSAVLAAMNAQGGRSGDIVLNIDGVSFARVTNPYQAKESTRIGPSMITVS